MVTKSNPYSIIGSGKTAAEISCAHSDIACCKHCQELIQYANILDRNLFRAREALEKLKGCEQVKDRKAEIARIKSGIQSAATAVEVLAYLEGR